METKLIFAADIVPTETNEQYFIDGDIEHLFGNDLLKYMLEADFRCFNLEVSLTEKKNTAKYPGPHLMAKPDTIKAISKINPSLLTLGNNHALDQGTEGLLNTISILEREKIPYTGVGSNIYEAESPYLVDLNGYKIGIFNCSEYEFAAATVNSAGVNPYDPLSSFDIVNSMNERCDVLVVLYHGGKEFYQYPSPQLQRVCRKFVDCGADLVICQHTHCIGCEEKYKEATIVYGQGNFLFDRNENELKKTGILVELVLNENGIKGVNYHPFVKKEECIRDANESQKTLIMEGFSKRSKEILIPGFVEKSYAELADQYFGQYVRKIIGGNKLIKVLNKFCMGKLYRCFYDDIQALAVLNVISPENHSELFKTGLRNLAEKKK